ncbi:hypothetical protein C8R46DRAFT_1184764 [Mycena filopes]|nr:hypothetical protein C8R46DRAFT_1184764 [Mycena filopes]
MLGASAANRVPFEIWLQIADLIGPAYSNSLYGVNRSWFEIVMNARYRVLDLTALNQEVLFRLSRLKDPRVANRVRILSISGLVLQKSLLSTIMGQKVEFPMDRQALSILNRRIRALDVVDVLNPQVHLISNVVSGSNVTEYSVKWDVREGIQSDELIHASLQAAILDVAWPAFGSTLKKLFVVTRPERFQAVLSSDIHLGCLEELHLELLHASNGGQSIADFRDHISAFFTRVNLNLAALTIQSSSNLDLSTLFDRLPLFTHLRELSLHIFLDHGVLSDPSGLESFFGASSLKLRHLTLCLYHAAVSSAERDLPTLALARARIPTLETLDINFGMPHPVLIDTLLHELHGVFTSARTTLTTVTLQGIALSYPDLAALTSLFAVEGQALQSLTVSMHTLTAPHIDTLAQNAPHICALGIIFMRLSLAPDGAPAPESLCRENFATEMRARRYPAWKLADISIWHRSKSVDTSRWDLVSPFSACVPSISTFFGHPVLLARQTPSIAVPRMLAALA